MATNLLRVGDELQINQSPNVDNNQAASYVTALTNGRFFVSYDDEGGDGTDIIGQFINADGGLGTHSTGNTGPASASGHQNKSAVAARADGTVLIAWEDPASEDVRFTFIGADGKNTITGPGGGGASLSVVDGAGLRDADVATFANGDSIIVYENEFILPDVDISARIIPASGLPMSGPSRSIDFTGNGVPSIDPAVATSGTKALIAYADKRSDGNDATTDNFDIRVALFDGQTRLVVEPTNPQPIANRIGDLGNVDIAALKDGRYVVVYQDTTNGDVYGRFVTAAGIAEGAEFVIAKTTAAEQFPSVAALPDGGFIVSWDRNANGVEDVVARRFLSDGTPGGDSFRVNAVAGSSFASSIAANADGKVFITFTSIAPQLLDGDGSSIRGSLFQVTNQPVNGSANADTIAAYNLGEKISGLAGDDTIDAKGGDDTVDGNEGKDTLTGGPGGDTFVFSAKLKKANVDHITDFTPGTDTVQIDASVFKKLGPGDLSRKAFFAKKNADSAKDKKDRIIYDTKSGELYFDKDGKGGKGGKLFAILDGKPDIDHGDIVIIA